MVQDMSKSRTKKHAFELSDLSDRQVSILKEQAVKKFIDSSETRNVVLIIDVFLEYLLQNGYVIKKEEDEGV